MTYSQEIDAAIKIVLSAVLGGIIGMEREHDRRPAGLRTNMLICIGSTVDGLIGMYTFSDSASLSRIWQNILTGVGFLGAGVVIKDEHGVKGLTTAAGIWAVAGIGLAVAGGLYCLELAAEVVILITLLLLRRVEHHLPSEEGESSTARRAMEEKSAR